MRAAATATEARRGTRVQPVVFRTSELPGEKDYRGAELALATELAHHRPGMPARAEAAIDHNLRVVDEAIETTREALREDPDDPELREELDRTWDEKLDLLAMASELPSER